MEIDTEWAILDEGSALHDCREALVLKIEHPAIFCLAARVSLDRFDAVERGERRPSPLLLEWAVVRATEARAKLRSYRGRLLVREAWLKAKLPDSFALPEPDISDFQPLTAWQLPRLSVTFVRVTQGRLAQDSGIRQSFISRVEKNHVKLSPRLAIEYLTHVTSELRYADSAVSSVERAWEELEVLTSAGRIDADGAR